jgi:hypothetical protein
VDYLVQEAQLTVKQACACVALSRASYYRKPADKGIKDAPVIDALNTIVAKHARWGFSLCFDRLRNQGYAWNRKRVWRIYTDMKLNMPRRTKKRLPKRLKQPLVAPTRPNHIWSLDFMHDALYRGKAFRTLNVMDKSNREALTIEIDFSLPSARVIRVLEQLEEIHGLPEAIRLDNELNAIGVVQKEQTHSLTADSSQKNSSVTLPLKPVVASTHQTGQRFTIMNTRSVSSLLRSSPNLKQSGAQWKVRTLSTGSYRPQRPDRAGSIHWAKLQSNPDRAYLI